MTVVVKLPSCRRQDVEETVRSIARGPSQNVVILPHAKARMTQRGITMRQVMRTLAHGALEDAPKWDAKKDKGWRCRFGRIDAGVKVTAVVKIIESNGIRCLLVTVF